MQQFLFLETSLIEKMELGKNGLQIIVKKVKNAGKIDSFGDQSDLDSDIVWPNCLLINSLSEW